MPSVLFCGETEPGLQGVLAAAGVEVRLAKDVSAAAAALAAAPVDALLGTPDAAPLITALRTAGVGPMPPWLAVAADADDAAVAREAGADAISPPWGAALADAVSRLAASTARADELSRLHTQARHRDMFFQMSLDMLCIADLNGRFIHLNPAWSALGWSMEELMAHPFLHFVHPDDVAPTLEIMGRLTTSDFSTISFENRYRCKDGSYRWLLWSSSTGYGALGPEDRLYYAVARDITQRKAEEEKIRTQAERLARSNEELEHFAHVASHDLKEPLRVVAGYLQLIQRRYRGQLDTQADEFIDFAVDGAARMNILIEDLLRFARVSSEQIEAQPIETDVAVGRVLSDLATLLDEAGAEVTVDPLPNVLASPGLLRQVFQNLIANAVKFRQPGVTPKVRIWARSYPFSGPAAMVTFTVTDNGIGIAPEYQSAIFELFRRLHGRTEYAGTGLGLAIVKKIVERHGGRIWVESEPGQGASFRFTLPQAPAAGGRAAP